MHQHLRPAKRPSPANASNQPSARVPSDGSVRKSSAPIIASETSSPNPGSLSENVPSDSSSTGQSSDTSKLNLIIQHFFSKTALIIARNRVDLPQAFTQEHALRFDRWFNLWVEDTNALLSSLHDWRTLEANERRPEPLVMDVYMDTAQLAQDQSLVILDHVGRRHDVSEYLRQKAQSELLTGSAATRLIYERWTVSLRDPPQSHINPSKPEAPPNTYKNAVVLLRSLFTFIKIMPGSKLAQRGSKATTDNRKYPKSHLSISNRITTDARRDSLRWPILPGAGGAVEDHHFDPLPCAFGSLHVSVTYRTACRFEIDSAERHLSARLAPSTTAYGPSSRTSGSQSDDSSGGAVLYSPWARLPGDSSAKSDDRSRSAIYSTSAPRTIGQPNPRPMPAPRRLSTTTFQPFKAGSLSSSPGAGGQMSASPSSSLGRTKGIPSSFSREKSSLTGPAPAREAVPSASTSVDAKSTTITSPETRSPKPASMQRFSSSFGNRKARISATTITASSAKQDDDNASSGKGSVSSNMRASVNNLTDSEHAVLGTQDDSEGISDFLKMLDKSSKGLASFNKTDQATVDANSQRTAAQFSKFSRMRDSTVQLSESMSSSLMLQRSSGSLNRQYGSTGLTGTSPSSSTSPGKPVSPHSTHIPAVPSRLSNASIAEYTSGSSQQRVETLAPLLDGQEARVDVPGSVSKTPAINIPQSPRAYPIGSSRRSSSVNPQTRVSMVGVLDDDGLPFDLRSMSLPNELANESGAAAYGTDDDEPLLFAMGELGLSIHQTSHPPQGSGTGPGR